MNVTDAAYDTVHQYPGGSEALAPRMSKNLSAATLRAKVNPNTDRNLLSLQEADEMMGKSNDYQILHALAATHGFVAIRVDGEDEGEGGLVTSLLEAGKAKGDLQGLVSDALTDLIITPNERANIVRAVMRAIQKLSAVAQHATAASRKEGPGAA